MTDYLQQLCVDKDVQLFYTNNLTPILSSYDQYGVKNIVAHNSFRESSKELATAVVNYYTQDKDKELNFNILKKILSKYFKSGTYKIDSIKIVLEEATEKDLKVKVQEERQEEVPVAEEQKPKSKNKNEVQNKKQPKTKRKKQSPIEEKIGGDAAEAKPIAKSKKTAPSKKSKTSIEKNNIIEVGIKNITKKSFKGNTTEIQSNESIRVAEDDVIELDITIDPFNT